MPRHSVNRWHCPEKCDSTPCCPESTPTDGPLPLLVYHHDLAILWIAIWMTRPSWPLTINSGVNDCEEWATVGTWIVSLPSVFLRSSWVPFPSLFRRMARESHVEQIPTTCHLHAGPHMGWMVLVNDSGPFCTSTFTSPLEIPLMLIYTSITISIDPDSSDQFNVVHVCVYWSWSTATNDPIKCPDSIRLYISTVLYAKYAAD